jgi:hypothetical protein
MSQLIVSPTKDKLFLLLRIIFMPLLVVVVLRMLFHHCGLLLRPLLGLLPLLQALRQVTL